MALTDEQDALLSTTDLEVVWLRKLSSNYAPNTLPGLRALVMPDGEFFYGRIRAVSPLLKTTRWRTTRSLQCRGLRREQPAASRTSHERSTH